jgi:large subunit ribosomal protein L37e
MAKALRRRTEGTGRMRKLKELPRKAKNGFREGKMAGRGFTCQRLYK